MNFGPPSLCPPYFYLVLLPNDYGISSPNPPLEGGQQAASAPVAVPPEQRIIVTREDLLQEGYQQTKKAWTEEEDQMLLKLCSNRHFKFEEIAKLMPERNAKMCYSRYRRLTNQSKDCWNKNQNEKLKYYVQRYGESNWRALEQHFPNRNYKQLKDHYENYLRPNIANNEWTVEEDLQLIELLNQHGKNWKLIETQMPSRSKNQLKNRYFGRIKRINTKKLQSLKDEASGNKLSLLPI